MELVNPTIFIGSYKGSPFLQGCLDSIPSDISCIVVRDDGYECGALRHTQQHFQGDQFLFLQDSTRVKDPSWIYRIFEDTETAWGLGEETGWGSMFMAKYRMEYFRQLIIPETKTKMDAVVAEMALPNAYARLDPNCKTLWPDLRLENATPDRIFDREVMIYENEFFWKAKSTWGGWMVTDSCMRDQARRQKVA